MNLCTKSHEQSTFPPTVLNVTLLGNETKIMLTEPEMKLVTACIHIQYTLCDCISGRYFFIMLSVLYIQKLQPAQESDWKGQLECGREADLDETSNQLT